MPATLLSSKHLEGGKQVLTVLISELQTLPCTQESSSKYWLKGSADVGCLGIYRVFSDGSWRNSDKERKKDSSDTELISE